MNSLPPTRATRVPSWVTPLLAAVWLVVVMAGMAWTWRYKMTPGDPGAAPARWPADSRLERAARMPTLVLVAHPRCPCTRASIAELARLESAIGREIALRVIFVRPSDDDGQWRSSDLWQRAGEIPGAVVVDDPGGHEAARFGVRTSGDTLLYDEAGRLAYSGGLTAARAHEGTSAGFRALVSIVRGASVDHTTFPVFGCALPPAEPEAAAIEAPDPPKSET